MKYHRIYDGYQLIFMGEDGQRLVVFDWVETHNQVTFVIQNNRHLLWTDHETGEKFEVHEDMG